MLYAKNVTNRLFFVFYRIKLTFEVATNGTKQKKIIQSHFVNSLNLIVFSIFHIFRIKTA